MRRSPEEIWATALDVLEGTVAALGDLDPTAAPPEAWDKLVAASFAVADAARLVRAHRP